MAAETCPKCRKTVGAEDETCPHCGVELAGSQAAAPVAAPRSDTQQYAIIIGAIILVGAVLLFATGLMDPSGTCKDCKGRGIVTCQTCGGGKPKCIECKGSGLDPQTQGTCLRCNGAGTLPVVCPKCRGEGKHRCTACGGTGRRERINN